MRIEAVIIYHNQAGCCGKTGVFGRLLDTWFCNADWNGSLVVPYSGISIFSKVRRLIYMKYCGMWSMAGFLSGDGYLRITFG
jgi:hypothetical protein